MAELPSVAWSTLGANLANHNVDPMTAPNAFATTAGALGNMATSTAQAQGQQIANTQKDWETKRQRATTDIYHQITAPDGTIDDAKASEYMKTNPQYSDLILGMRGAVQGLAEKAASIASTQAGTATTQAKLPAVGARSEYEAKTIQGLPSAFGNLGSPFTVNLGTLKSEDKQAATRFAGSAGAGAGEDAGKTLQGMENAREEQIWADAQQRFLAGDLGAIPKAKADIKALRAGGFMKEALGAGREAITTDISQESGKQGIVRGAQAIQQTQQVLDSVDEWRKAGFSRLTSDALEKANALHGRVLSIYGSADMAKDILKNPKSIASMSDDEFGEKVFNVLKGIKTAEGVNTISADESLSSYFRPEKSLGKIIAGGDDAGHIIAAIAKNKFSASQREQILMDAASMAKDAAKYGIARSELRTYGRGRLPEEKE